MTKLLSIVFANLILFQSFNISLEDFSKLDVLMEHAAYHQETYGDSFLEFISEHYGSDNFEHGMEHDEHEELPFKHEHQTCHQPPTAFAVLDFNLDIKQQIYVNKSANFFYKESHSLFEKPSVFQPPKQA